jgi:hypothetical protein
MRDWITFFTDTGASLPAVIDALTGKSTINHHPDCPTYDQAEAEAGIRAMIADGTLSCGPAHGWDEYLVVTKFMPRTAEMLRR